MKPKRFGYGFYGTDRANLVAFVRAAERFGYDTFIMPDHLAEQMSPIPALAVVAEVSDTLRIAPWVLCNDFHIPQILARELATLDALSGGRLDVGLGALAAVQRKIGWVREAAGSRFADITLNLALVDMKITNNPRESARAVSHAISSGQLPMFVVDTALTEDDLLESPYFAFGPPKAIAEHVETVFEQTGVSYYGLFAHLPDSFGPILEHLVG